MEIADARAQKKRTSRWTFSQAPLAPSGSRANFPSCGTPCRASKRAFI